MYDLYTVMQSVNVDLTDIQTNQFNIFYKMLIDTNKVMNLTAITDYDEVLIKHFADSVAIRNVYDMSSVKNMIDVGTGAGFPGIALKIIYPDTEVLLLDSLKKRIGFLDSVIERLGLTGIKTVHGRAEDIAHNEQYREKYDLCVSRAVAALSSLSEYCIPFVKKGGAFVSYKAAECGQEVEAAKRAVGLLGGQIREIAEYTLGPDKLVRKFVIIDKSQQTSVKYPRKAGVPSREPLK
ncbi:MAG: 16S rRNA (guanine(527)-N(7))-methyltransferase RsmG [Butyrivibrio sp.]|nr:16S rRNA (guanine(527)-N(7))-methyltransferase RsmG [Butyrivibrio sp.]